jgi:N-acetylglucosamine-6-phosphate deacetylase
MSDLLAISGASIFDGEQWHDDAALLVEFGYISGIVAVSDAPAQCEHIKLDGGMLVPGFIDLQVNGGGGVLFNNAPTAEAIGTICASHAQFGTTALLPTLITDTVDVTEAAIAAGVAAYEQRIPGFLGLHLEGPHLSLARKGTHDPALIRPMESADLNRLIRAAEALPTLLVTAAPESVAAGQISALAEAGVIVSIGHSDASYDEAKAAFDAGATMATHLFNAMSQLGNRDPGVVGAVLDSPDVFAGLIADGIHVHKASIGVALRARRAAGRVFLVTDAMSQTGTDIASILLNGRIITRADGALRLADGTLAGADLDMIDAVNFIIDEIGLDISEALRMAALYPAEAIGKAETHGHLRPGATGSFVHLSADRKVRSTWIDGECVWSA